MNKTHLGLADDAIQIPEVELRRNMTATEMAMTGMANMAKDLV